MATRLDSWRGGGTGRGAYTLIANAATQIPLRVQAASGQTADVFQVIDSADSVLFGVDPSGNLTIAGTATISINEAVTGNISLTGNLTVNGNSTLGDASTDTLTVNATSTFITAVRMNSSLTVDLNTVFNGITSAPAMHMRIRTASPANIGSNGILYTQAGDTDTTELWYKDAAGNEVQITDAGALDGASLFWDDDEYIRMGNTAASPDVRFGWNTTQTVDGLYLGLSDAQNTFIIAENGDRAFDFAKGAQTNPTLYIQSAAQTEANYISFTHDQTNAVIDVGAGDLVLTIAGANLVPSANDAWALGVSGTAVSDIFLASGAVIDLAAGDVVLTHSANTLTMTGGNLVLTQPVVDASTPTALTVTGGAHTAITAATEDIGVNFNFSATKTWAAGAGPLAVQREIVFQAPTYV